MLGINLVTCIILFLNTDNTEQIRNIATNTTSLRSIMFDNQSSAQFLKTVMHYV